MNNQYNYTNLKSLTSDLHNLLIDNELNVLKLQAIKEFIDKQNDDIANLTKIGDSYENGYSDAIYKMYSEINKIINK